MSTSGKKTFTIKGGRHFSGPTAGVGPTGVTPRHGEGPTEEPSPGWTVRMECERSPDETRNLETLR